MNERVSDEWLADLALNAELLSMTPKCERVPLTQDAWKLYARAIEELQERRAQQCETCDYWGTIACARIDVPAANAYCSFWRGTDD